MNRPRSGSTANACTDVSTPERTMNAPSSDSENARDREQHGPALERAAFLGDRQRVHEGGAHQPRHERRILDRIPEPPAAPAEFVVRPPAAERDADGEKRPRRRSSTAATSAPTRRRGARSSARRARTRTRPKTRRSPMYRIGGWIVRPKSCSSGLRSAPSLGAIGNARSNGLLVNSENAAKSGGEPAHHARARG